MNIWYDIFGWATIIVLNEFGHYVALKAFGTDPYLEYRWCGFVWDMVSNIDQSINQRLIGGFAGISAGLIPLTILFNDHYILYLVMCVMDLSVLILYICIKPRFWNTKMKYLLYRKDVLTFPKWIEPLQI